MNPYHLIADEIVIRKEEMTHTELLTFCYIDEDPEVAIKILIEHYLQSPSAIADCHTIGYFDGFLVMTELESDVMTLKDMYGGFIMRQGVGNMVSRQRFAKGIERLGVPRITVKSNTVAFSNIRFKTEEEIDEEEIIEKTEEDREWEL